MTSVTRIFPEAGQNLYLGPAVVLAMDAARERASVRIGRMSAITETWARVPYPLSKTVEEGDEVLVGGDGMDEFFVVGLLSQPKSETEIIKTKDGASAIIRRNSNHSGKEVIRVFSKEAALLFEYDPQADTTRVSIPSGGLEFAARKGDIKFSSEKAIRFRAKDIQLQALSGIKIKIPQILQKLGSTISLTPGKAEIKTSKLKIVGERGDIFINQLCYRGKEIIGKIAHVQFIANKIESTAKTVVAKAENMYKAIKELSYLKAGRKRTIVESTFYLKSKTSILKSDKDFKIKGHKIHLG